MEMGGERGGRPWIKKCWATLDTESIGADESPNRIFSRRVDGYACDNKHTNQSKP